jgi:hypothetical protein
MSEEPTCSKNSAGILEQSIYLVTIDCSKISAMNWALIVFLSGNQTIRTPICPGTGPNCASLLVFGNGFREACLPIKKLTKRGPPTYPGTTVVHE